MNFYNFYLYFLLNITIIGYASAQPKSLLSDALALATTSTYELPPESFRKLPDEKYDQMNEEAVKVIFEDFLSSNLNNTKSTPLSSHDNYTKRNDSYRDDSIESDDSDDEREHKKDMRDLLQNQPPRSPNIKTANPKKFLAR